MSRTTIPSSWMSAKQPPHGEEPLADLAPGRAAAVGRGGVGEQLVRLGIGEPVARGAQVAQHRLDGRQQRLGLARA